MGSGNELFSGRLQLDALHSSPVPFYEIDWMKEHYAPEAAANACLLSSKNCCHKLVHPVVADFLVACGMTMNHLMGLYFDKLVEPEAESELAAVEVEDGTSEKNGKAH